MDMVHDIFAHRRVLWERLPHLGFAQSKDGLVRTSVLPGTGLVLEVVVSAEGKVFTTVTDPAFGEPYTLHLTDEAVWAFVGRVRGGYALALQEIADKATVLDVFRTTQAQGLIDYALHSFGETLEHLWPKTPEYAILRRADTGKWYLSSCAFRAQKSALQAQNSSRSPTFGPTLQHGLHHDLCLWFVTSLHVIAVQGPEQEKRAPPNSETLVPGRSGPNEKGRTRP